MYGICTNRLGKLAVVPVKFYNFTIAPKSHGRENV